MKLAKLVLSAFGVASAGPSVQPTETAIKEVWYRGGLVIFELPSDWLEEYEPDGGGMFYADGPDTGTLRLNVITAESKSALPPDEPMEILKGIRGVDPTKIRRLPNGNLVAEYVQHSVEQGTRITLFWWSVTNVVPPRHVRIANFSYTVRSSLQGATTTLAEVAMLRRSIERARFSPELGETGRIQ